MSGDITAYQKGLEVKKDLEGERKAATTKAPAQPLSVQQQSYWINNCTDFKHTTDLSITYLKHTSISQGQMNDINKAISYVEQANTGQWLLGEIKNMQNVKVGVHFFADRSDYPWPSDVNPSETGHTDLMSGIASTPLIYWIRIFAARRTPECIAESLFHELLHVWFLGTHSGHNKDKGTGHDEGATISIDQECNKKYAGYNPDFVKKLDEFDNDLENNIPGAKKCCSE